MSQTFSLSSNKQNFHAEKWVVPNPKAILCIVHGHGEHVARYDHVAQYLNGLGISCMGFDLYGHGKTTYKKGHWPSYEAVLDSISVLIEEAGKEHKDKPIFLYGHSKGGNLVANYALRRKPDIAGVILSAPWFRLAFTPSSTDLFLAKMMLNIYPSFTQASKLDASAISRDQQEVDKYMADPLVHDLVSPVMFTSTHQAGLWALEHAGEFALPLLHMHGDADRLTSFDASKEFAAHAGGGDVTFQAFPGYFHEMHNESQEDRKPVLELIGNWISERC